MILGQSQHKADAFPSILSRSFLDLPLELRLQVYHAVLGVHTTTIKKRTRSQNVPDISRLALQYRIRDSSMAPVAALLLVCKQINSEVRTEVISRMSLDLSRHAIALRDKVRQIPWLLSLIKSTPVIMCSMDGAQYLSGIFAGSCQQVRDIVIFDTSPFIRALPQPETYASHIFRFPPGDDKCNYQRNQIEGLRLAVNALKGRGPNIKIRSRQRVGPSPSRGTIAY